MNDIYKFLKSLDIYEDDKVVLACSYGPDSMALLDILIKLNFDVVVAHVNHKLRKESDKECEDLAKYCKERNIIFETTTIDEYPKGNTEAYARTFRYNYFKEIMARYNAIYLFTAHHGDDLIETVLMRISRGASLSGYAGFRLITEQENYKIARPLIYLTKEEILNYNKENNIPYAIDETNNTDDYTRNKYRHKILPLLKEINPKIHNKFIKFSNNITECSDYIDRTVNEVFKNIYVDNHIDLNNFYLLDNYIQKKLLEKILLNIYKNEINKISEIHVNLILDLIYSPKVNSIINLPGNIKVAKFYNMLIFDYKENINEYDYKMENETIINGGIIKFIDECDILKSNYVLRLNKKDVKWPLHVRSRKVGDKIALKNGTKKVGEILSEAKIMKSERDIYPIVCDDADNILWIPGVKKSKYDRNYNDDYDIIVKYIKKGDRNEK